MDLIHSGISLTHPTKLNVSSEIYSAIFLLHHLNPASFKHNMYLLSKTTAFSRHWVFNYLLNTENPSPISTFYPLKKHYEAAYLPTSIQF